MKPKDELFLNEKLEKERGTSDGKYALKFVEKLAIGFVVMCLVAIVTAILAIVIKKPL